MVGLDAIAADFRALPEALQEGIQELTPQLAVYVQGITKAAASTKAEKKVAGGAITVKGSGVVLGGSDRAGLMALGTEHGGKRRKTTQQFRQWRGKEGYFFWPAIRSHSDEIKKKWDAMLDVIIEKLASG